MVKPFELPELLARLRALLRRSQAATSAVLSFGSLEMDTAHRTVRVGGQPLEVGPREWTVLEYLLLQAPKPRRQRQTAASPDRVGQGNHAQRHRGVHLAAALQAGASGVVLRAIRGFGYRLELAEPAGGAASKEGEVVVVHTCGRGSSVASARWPMKGRRPQPLS